MKTQLFLPQNSGLFLPVSKHLLRALYGVGMFSPNGLNFLISVVHFILKENSIRTGFSYPRCKEEETKFAILFIKASPSWGQIFSVFCSQCLYMLPLSDHLFVGLMFLLCILFVLEVSQSLLQIVMV